MVYKANICQERGWKRSSKFPSSRDCDPALFGRHSMKSNKYIDFSLQTMKDKKTAKRNNRADHSKGQRQIYEKNRRRVIAAGTLCALCGAPVDKKLKFPHPLSATADHIIPISKGGSNDIDNLQLAHLWCNRQKADRIVIGEMKKHSEAAALIPNDRLPLTMDWMAYKPV